MVNDTFKWNLQVPLQLGLFSCCVSIDLIGGRDDSLHDMLEDCNLAVSSSSILDLFTLADVFGQTMEHMSSFAFPTMI